MMRRWFWFIEAHWLDLSVFYVRIWELNLLNRAIVNTHQLLWSRSSVILNSRDFFFFFVCHDNDHNQRSLTMISEFNRQKFVSIRVFSLLLLGSINNIKSIYACNMIEVAYLSIVLYDFSLCHWFWLSVFFFRVSESVLLFSFLFSTRILVWNHKKMTHI